MVEGPPVQYYALTSYQHQQRTEFDLGFLNRFATSYDLMTEEPMMPLRSPANSINSDSDNSQCSIEVSPTRTTAASPLDPTRTVSILSTRCRWRNCGINLDSLDELAAHVGKVHASSGAGGLFFCGWDGCARNHKGFNARYKMLVHVRTHTNEKPHQCWQCDKSFSRAENLKIHTRSHSGEKPYTCPVAGCNKAYSNSSDRFKHTRTHQVDKPYQCKYSGCAKRYTDPSSLRKHVKTYKHFADAYAPPISEVEPELNVTSNESSPVAHAHFEDQVVENSAGDELLTVIGRRSSGIDCNTVDSWSHVLVPAKLFTPYDLDGDHRMDIDRPLDLSISGRQRHLV